MKVEQLNLHGLSLEEALQKTRQNLQWCMSNRVDVLDINHGKGFHSERRFSVLKQEVRRFLKEEAALGSNDYRLIYGESDFPVALAFDEGHTLVVAKGCENEFIGARSKQERNQRVFSEEGRIQRKAQKGIRKERKKRP
ncbi:MAG: Smr/MutS family protein [Syntrophomonas sp.]